MHMAAIALYSSSPPAAAWPAQSSFGSSTSAFHEVDIHSRAGAHHHPHHHHQHQSSGGRSVVGGLTGLFASNSSSGRSSSLSPGTLVGDGSDYSSSSSSLGMVRSSSMDNLCHNVGTWDSSDARAGGSSSSLSVPSGHHLFRLRERSPVSVLHGPSTSRSSHSHNLTTSSSAAAAHHAVDSSGAVGSSGLPPLDPHLDRHTRRRSLHGAGTDERHPATRSVGFEVGSESSSRGLAGLHSRLMNADSSLATCTSGSGSSSTSSSPSEDARREEQLGRFFAQDGFLRPAGAAAVPLSEAFLSRIDGEWRQQQQQEFQDARKLLARLALETSTTATGAAPTGRTSILPLSADELLVDAQDRHKIFFDPFVIKAFGVAKEAHGGQLRRSGGLYLTHCVETAVLLANTGADSTVVAAGLLHDTIDDSSLDQAQIRVLMGAEVENLVSGVSKLSAVSQLARDNEIARNPEEADRLRTMFLAMVDVRVVLIKLADRLHNLRTLDVLPAAKRVRIAKESMEILAPLANRLGIWSWKAEMEDICFRHLKPREYEELALKLSDGWKKGVVVSSILQLEKALQGEGVEFTDICGRPKNLYSIYSKMIRKGRSIDEIFDVRGLRLIVKDVDSCYAAMNVVHRLWAHSPKVLKDYIASPKANGYQSLHTVVWGEDGRPMEVQIRTTDMHLQAEYGMAAHWRYKETDSKHSSFVQQKVEWARWVLTWHSEILDTKLRVSPPLFDADLKPPCPFPFHKEDCPYTSVCSLPPQSKDDPLFVIMLKDQNMIVRELNPGSTAADLLVESSSDRDSVSISGKHLSRKFRTRRAKVNHEFVENAQQKLRMGDLVEVTVEPEGTPLMVPLSMRASELTQAQIVALSSPEEQQPCGEIALEFQREQLKRLYLDGGRRGGQKGGKRGSSTQETKNATVASLT